MNANASRSMLVFSMHDEALFAERAFRAGTRAYVMRGEGIDVMIHAIREVLAGRLYGRPIGGPGPHVWGRPGDRVEGELVRKTKGACH